MQWQVTGGWKADVTFVILVAKLCDLDVRHVAVSSVRAWCLFAILWAVVFVERVPVEGEPS